MYDLTVQHVCELVVVIAECSVSAELLDSRVIVDILDEAVGVEALGINDAVAVPMRLEYAPLGALTANRFNMACCNTAQL